MTVEAASNVQGLSFDEILERLRQVVDRLESSDLSLEQSLEAFEQGVRLCRQGTTILDAAEKRVEILLKGEDGSLRTEPLDGPLAEADPSPTRQPR